MQSLALIIFYFGLSENDAERWHDDLLFYITLTLFCFVYTGTNNNHHQSNHFIVCKVYNYFLYFSVLGAQTRQSPVLIIFYFGLCENDPMHARRTLVLYFTHFVLFFIHSNQQEPTPKTTFAEMSSDLNDDDLMNLIFCKFLVALTNTLSIIILFGTEHIVPYNLNWYNLNFLIFGSLLSTQSNGLNYYYQRAMHCV